MFKEIALKGILAIAETPLVSSIIPENRPLAKDAGIFNSLRKGARKIFKASNILALLIIEIITLKSITKPPIITIVLIELIILFCKILPRLLKVGAVFETLLNFFESI